MYADSRFLRQSSNQVAMKILLKSRKKRQNWYTLKLVAEGNDQLFIIKVYSTDMHIVMVSNFIKYV